jgi:lipopolysaccharide/colanic/teichoic acid biosynthesis glycosyltransferase
MYWRGYRSDRTTSFVTWIFTYGSEAQKGHEVRPAGIGLAQVKGRNQMKFSEDWKTMSTMWIILSFVDVKILIMTVSSVF